MKINKQTSICRWVFLLAILLSLLFISSSFAGPQGQVKAVSSFASAIIILIVVFAIQLSLFPLWFYLYIKPKRKTRAILFSRITVDFALMVSLSWATTLLYTIIFKPRGLLEVWSAFFEPEKSWFYLSRVCILIAAFTLVLISAHYFTRKKERLFKICFHFFLCLGLALSFNIIFNPQVMGSVTRWFVDPHKLFIELGDPGDVYSNNKKWSEIYGFDKSDLKRSMSSKTTKKK